LSVRNIPDKSKLHSMKTPGYQRLSTLLESCDEEHIDIEKFITLMSPLKEDPTLDNLDMVKFVEVLTKAIEKTSQTGLEKHFSTIIYIIVIIT